MLRKYSFTFVNQVTLATEPLHSPAVSLGRPSPQILYWLVKDRKVPLSRANFELQGRRCQHTLLRPAFGIHDCKSMQKRAEEI